jgi:C4-dicarboxylate-specific signal transduction histidine kinase
MNTYEDKEVAFFGKITAGITHELKNVLAIIRESSGLMADIISISPEAIVKYQEKIQNSMVKIKEQIDRGIDLTDTLNKFAHITDVDLAKIDLQETIEQLVTLAQRFARLKHVVLKIVPQNQENPAVTLITRHVQLQMVLFASLECCFNAMSHGGEINIGMRKNEGKNAVYMECQGDLPGQADFARNISEFENWQVLEKIAAGLEASVHLDEIEHGIVLCFPDKISP